MLRPLIHNIFILGLIWGCTSADLGDVSSTSKTADVSLINDAIKESIQTGICNISINLGRLLYKRDTGKNVIFSPLNIYNALAFLHEGSASSTQDELANILGFSTDTEFLSDSIHKTFGNITKSLQASVKANVSIVTGLFVKSGVELKTDYEQQVKMNYDTEIKKLDFSLSNTTDIINQWISDKTKNHIKKLFTSPIEGDTQMILSSVTYFNAIWKYRFDERSTSKENFTVYADQTVEVDMMTNLKETPYFNDEEKKYRVMGLPYLKSEFTMYFILPHENQTVAALSENLKYNDLQNIVNATDGQQEWVRYKIPRTKFSWKSDIGDDLKGLGLKTIFDKPDFSNMMYESVKVTNVAHASEIEINEDGTTASAVTGITISVESAHYPWGEPKKFELNKPFLLFLYHHETKTVLFYGAVHKPQG